MNPWKQVIWLKKDSAEILNIMESNLASNEEKYIEVYLKYFEELNESEKKVLEKILNLSF